MATLQQRLTALTQSIGADISALLTSRGNLASLTTTAKSNLVAAINELKTAIDGVGEGGGAPIDDNNASTSSVYSSSKVNQVVQAAISGLLGADVDAAYDTLKELETWIKTNATAASNLTTAVGNRVSYADAQSLTAPQQAQARANIGALSTVELGDPDTDLVAIYTAAKA